MSADCVELERKLAEARDLAVALGRELAAARNEHCDSDCACRDDDGRSSEPTPWGDLD